jgi:hypothetical protein
VREIRIFLRTKMKSSFLSALGATISCVGIIGAILWIASNIEEVREGGLDAWIAPFLFILIATMGKIFEIKGDRGILTADSGVWDEIRKKTSLWQRFIGDVPVIEKDNFPPTFKKKSLFIFALSLIILGLLTIPFFCLILRNVNYLFWSVLIGPIFTVIYGVLLLINIKKNTKKEQLCKGIEE